MIKVGQIWDKYKDDNTLRSKVCVTYIYYYSNGGVEVDYITKDGICFSHDDEYFLRLHRKCIAEYPTWQEAVNSKEFKGE